jgi:predicted extracellular nuclease
VRRALRVGSASSEVKGWRQPVLDRKLAQLASVIMRMNAGRGPDILGLCEVENRHVLDLLVKALTPLGRSYGVVHADTSDRRGIDVAFLYDRGVFHVKPAEVFSHFIVKRTATRDLLQVTFRDPQGRQLVCIANHWPSRLGGQFESEPFRIIAAETLAYFHERIIDILGKDVAVLALGDFNDEPFDRSLAQHARTERTRAKVTRATLPAFLNLMWPPVGQLQGTHFHQNRPAVLDQMLASKGLLTGKSGFVVQPALTHVVAFPDMIKGGQYPQPRRFGRPSSRKDFDLDGFSDHYPIVAVLKAG